MAQKLDPFIGSNYGWDEGENGWGEPMNDNLLQFSFLHNRNIDGIVSTLPASPSNGDAYFNTSDNLAYYRVDNLWYNTQLPFGFEVIIKSTGDLYSFNGTTLVLVPSSDQLEDDLTALSVQLDDIEDRVEVLENNENSYTEDLYYATSKDLSGLIKTHGKKVVITGDSLSYNNYGFGFPYASTAQEAYAGIRSCGFMLRDAIHMSDPCFVYGDNIPWHIKNPAHAAVGINTTAAYILPFNNRSSKFVVTNAAAEITLTLTSFNIQNKQIILHLAHDPLSEGKFGVYYNNNTGGADVFVQTVEVGNGVDHQGFAPFTVTIPVNTADSCARIIFKSFTNVNGTTPLSAPMAFYVLAAGSKLTNVYTTGVGGSNSDFFVTNYASKIGVYAPDILITFLGANDRLNRTLQQHLDSLTTIFNNARASNPAVRIIHITAPPAQASLGNPGYYPDSATNSADTVTMKQWVSGVESLCRELNVIFFNNYRFKYDIPQSELFVDGIHDSRPWGANTFYAIWSEFFSSAGAPIEHLSGYSTYSQDGIADLMGRQIGLIEQTRAMPKIKGQFKLTYVHGGTPSWTFSENYEFGTNRPSAIKSVTIIGNAHTTYLEFYTPVISTAYNEFPQPLTATAEYITGASVLISAVSISPQANNILKMTIRDLNGALIDPATMNGAQFIVKYQM